MSVLVLDASAALALLLQEDEPRALDDLASVVARGQAIAPDLLSHEVLNGLVSAHKRSRINAEQLLTVLEAWLQMPVQLHGAGKLAIQVEVTSLALLHGLSAYDAAYLELAKRLDVPLISFDKRLVAAAAIEGVSTTLAML